MQTFADCDREKRWRSGPIRRLWANLFLMVIVCGSGASGVGAEEKEGRYCIGLLWCREEREGAVSTDAFLYLYSSEQKGPLSRLAVRPFYFHEINPEEEYVRRSVLWPLGTYERTQERLWFHLFPLYWHGHEEDRRYTLALPLYLRYEKGRRAYVHYFPFYGHHADGEVYHRYFVLGPMFISTVDAKRGLSRWDLLFPLIGHRRENEAASTWLLPIYLAGYDQRENRSFRYLLPVYGEWKSPSRHHRFVFPLYGYHHEKDREEKRLSLLGLPPLPVSASFPTLAFFEHTTSPTRVTDRFFPVYRYDHSLEDETLRFSLIGHQAWSLFALEADESTIRHHLFPLYAYRRDREGERSDLAFVGFGPASLYRHRRDDQGVLDRFFPLYDYRVLGNPEERSWTLSLMGLSDLAFYYQRISPTQIEHRFFPVYGYRHDRVDKAIRFNFFFLYQHRSSPVRTIDRLFPIYRYRRDHSSGEVRWDLLFLYQHQSSPNYLKDAFLPLYHYERDRSHGTEELSLIGVSPLTLFAHRASTDRRFGYLFPLYGYRHASGEKRWSLFGLPPLGSSPAWALYEHRSEDDRTASRFFPLYRFSRDRRLKESALNVLLLYHHRATPRQTEDLLFPLYRYQRGKDEIDLSAIGYGIFSLAGYRKSPAELSHRFLPVYAYSLRREASLLNAFIVYWHRSTPDRVDDGVFPLYHVQNLPEKNSWRISVVGLEPLLPISLFSQRVGPEESRGFLFPLYDARREGERRSLSVLGISKIALYHHESDDAVTRDRLFPIYGYRNDRQKGEWHLGLLGVPPLSLYLHRSGPQVTIDRLFPLYRYRRHRQAKETRFDLLLIFHYLENPTRRSHFLFPIYHDEQDRVKEERRFGALGFGPVSLYRHVRAEGKIADHLFPLYTYASDAAKDRREFSLLWPFFHAKSEGGETQEVNVLWWLFQYERSEDGGKALRLLGGSAMAVIRREVAPERSVFEFNPVLPFFSYEREEGKGSRWNILGGLVGREIDDKGERRTRWLWIF